MASKRLVSVDFEVFGKVQGVFFRKNTKEKAQRLGLVGWVRNTEEKTVTGKIQGPAEQVERMKVWLRTEGSPKSRISRCDFKNERELSKVSCTAFEIKK